MPLCAEIDVGEAVALGVAVGPLKIIDKTPSVASDRWGCCLYYSKFKVQMMSVAVLSSTAARTALSSVACTARPNDPPWFGSTAICFTNLPSFVNSTISLGWFGSGLMPSLLVTSRWPFGAAASPSAPWRWTLSW